MAFGSIEFTTISRAQEYSAIKQNEDNKGMVDQSNIISQVHKQTEQKTREVHESDDVQWHERRPDAKEKGDNSYSGDGGKKRKGGQPREQMTVRKQGGFDIKI